MAVLIRACRAREIFDDPRSEQLLAEYSAECAIALIGRPSPRRDMYENLEACGMGHCFAAYEAGELCGFAMLLIAVVPHYSLSCGNLESLFVTRSAHCGGDLMRRVEEFARERGCTAILYTAPVNSRLARLLFLSEDRYMLVGHAFCRRLV
jgi:hypothetical protein